MKTTLIHILAALNWYLKNVREQRQIYSHVIALLVIHNTQTDELCGKNNNQDQFVFAPSCILFWIHDCDIPKWRSYVDQHKHNLLTPVHRQTSKLLNKQAKKQQWRWLNICSVTRCNVTLGNGIKPIYNYCIFWSRNTRKAFDTSIAPLGYHSNEIQFKTSFAQL